MSKIYAYNDIRIVHLELTSKCQAACPMCGRNNNGGSTRRNIPITELSVEKLKDWLPTAFLRQLDTLFMCGNFGDPIMARSCLPAFAYLRGVSPCLRLALHTNGSARSADFWRDLAKLDVVVHFGIDGASQESHARYRINTQFSRILQNAEAFISAGGHAVWEMLVFRHNDHELEAAGKLARKMGFSRFNPRYTDRFGPGRWAVENGDGAIVDHLQPSRRQPRQIEDRRLRLDVETCAIDCRVSRNGSIFISAEGLAFPCCWLGQEVNERPGAPDGRFELSYRTAGLESYFALFDDIGLANLDLRRSSLETIVTYAFPRIARRWARGEHRLEKCARVCGRVAEKCPPTRCPDVC